VIAQLTAVTIGTIEVLTPSATLAIRTRRMGRADGS
jgi:hypothetical protein